MAAILRVRKEGVASYFEISVIDELSLRCFSIAGCPCCDVAKL
jgi:hypothetical protein